MSVDQVSGVAGGATGTPLGGITGALQGGLNNLTNMGSNFLDKWFPPDKREELKSRLMKFASEKPMLASFILSQLALSGLPLALFIIMSITVFIFALLAGILVGVIGALLFVVFMLGVALFVLLPTLFVTTFFAVAVWLWGVGAYFIVKWFNEKSVPGIHVPLKDGLMKQTGLGNLPALKGTPLATENGSEETSSPTPTKKHAKAEKVHKSDKSATTTSSQPKSHTNGSVNGDSTPATHHADGKENQPRERHPKKLEDKSHTNSTNATPSKAVEDAAGGVGGVAKGLTA